MRAPRRQLTKILSVRISDADNQALMQLAAKLGITNRTRIVRKLICEIAGQDLYLVGTDLDTFREAVREVRAVGVNFNQLMHAINAGKLPRPFASDMESIQRVLSAIQRLREDLNAVIQRSRNQGRAHGF